MNEIRPSQHIQLSNLKELICYSISIWNTTSINMKKFAVVAILFAATLAVVSARTIDTNSSAFNLSLSKFSNSKYYVICSKHWRFYRTNIIWLESLTKYFIFFLIFVKWWISSLVSLEFQIWDVSYQTPSVSQFCLSFR